MATYAIASDLENEGADISDSARVTHALELATEYIDRMTRQWFEPRTKTVYYDGDEQTLIHLPVPAISITEITVGGLVLSTDSYTLYGDEGPPDDRKNPKIVFTSELQAGTRNVVIAGSFGFVDDPASAKTVPKLIKKACVMLALSELPQMLDDERGDEFQRGRVVEERTDGHSYKLSEIAVSAAYTGVKEIDDILVLYRAPVAMGLW